MIRCYILVFLFVHCFILVKAQNDTSFYVKTYSPRQLRQDVKYIRDSLTKKHPNLYWYISKHKLNKKFDSLEKSINAPLTAPQFQHKLLKVLANIGDGHINVTLNGDKMPAVDKDYYMGLKEYPLQQFDFKVIGKRLYVINNRSDNNLITPKAEIIAINGEPASAIIDHYYEQVQVDGYNQILKVAAINLAGNMSLIYSLLYGSKEQLTLTYKQNDSVKICTIPIRTKPKTDSKWENITSKTTVSGNYSPAYMTINQFAGQNDPFIGFFKMVKEQGVKCIILDLRNNQGGDLKQMIKVFAHFINKPAYFDKMKMGGLNNAQKATIRETDYGFKIPVQPDSNHFDGKLYVMVNGITFSAAALLADNLQGLNRATFVGQETAGGRNGCIGGLYHDGVLPNSGLLFRFGLAYFEIPSKDKQKGRGLIPDVPISYTLDDYIAQRDLEKEWILKDIKDKHILK